MADYNLYLNSNNNVKLIAVGQAGPRGPSSGIASGTAHHITIVNNIIDTGDQVVTSTGQSIVGRVPVITGANTYAWQAVGGTGTVTSVDLSTPSDLFIVSGNPITTSGTLNLAKANQGISTFYAAPASGTGLPTFRTITAADIRTLFAAGSGVTLTGSSTIIINATGGGSGSGSVTSVGLSLPNIFTVTGSPVTSAGTLSATLNSQAPLLVLGTPASGGTPLFRSINGSELPLSAGPNITLTPNGNNLVVGSTASGSVTSVGLNLPPIFNVSGSPITQSGTLTATLVSQPASTYLSGSGVFKAIASGDIYTPVSQLLVAGTNVSITPTAGTLVFSSVNTTYSAGAGINLTGTVFSSYASAAVLSVSGLSPLFTSAVSNGAVIFTASNVASGTALMGPVSGAAGSYSFRPIQSTDLYAIQAGPNITLSQVGSALIITSTASGGGGGSVTQVTSGNLANFATVSVATNTTTPAFTYTLTQPSSGLFWGGPATGLAAAPNYRNIALTDLPVGTYTINYSNTLNNIASAIGSNGSLLIGNASGGFTNALLTPGFGVQITNGNGSITISAASALGGTVTSVGLSAPSIFSVSGSPISNSGTLSLTLVNQASGTFFAGPLNGVNSVPGFRYIQNTDLGALQAGTGVTFSNVGSSLVINSSGTTYTAGPGIQINGSTISSYASAAVLSVGNLAPIFTSSLSNGAVSFTLSNVSSGYALLGPVSGNAAAPTYRPIQGIDLGAIQAGSNVIISTLGSALIISAQATGGGGGTVTSVSAGNLSPIFTTTVNTATTTPAISFSLNSQSASSFLAGPLSGSGSPTFRAIASSDIIQAVTGNLVAGTNIGITPSGNTLIISSPGSGNVNNFTAGNLSPLFITSVTNPTTAPTLSFTLNNAGSGLVFAGPLNGAAGAPTFRNVASGDFGSNLLDVSHGGSGLGTVPSNGQIDIGNGSGFVRTTLSNGPNITITNGAGSITIGSTASGSVTNFTSGNLTPWFNTSVSTSTSTPSLTFTPTGNKGDLHYYSANNTAANLGVGQTTQILMSSGGVPFYGNTLNGYASAVTSGNLTVASNSYQAIDASQSNVNLTLGAASSMPNKIFWFKNITVTGTNTANVLTNGTDQFEPNGTSKAVLKLQILGIISDGVQTWRYLKSQIESPQSGGTGSAVVPTDGQIPIGSTSGQVYTPANLTPGSGIQIVNGSGSITLSSYASAALISAGNLSPLFTTSISNGTLNFTGSTVASGTVLAGPTNGTAGAYIFRALASSDLYQALKSQILAGTNITVVPNDSTYTLTINSTGGSSYTAGSGIQINGTTISSYASAAVLSVGSLTPLFTSSLSNGSVTFAQQAQASGLVYAGPANGSSANPTFRALASGDTYSALITNLIAGTGITLTPNAANKTITITSTATGGGGGGTTLNNVQDFRLTLTSGTPITTNDVIGAGTLYLTPYKGNSISLYDGSTTWTTYTSTEMSISVPASVHRLYDVFIYNNSGTPTLELNAWDSGGQVTGSITSATAASPCVLTANNSLSVGDYVIVDGITGTLGTDAVAGLNGKSCRVSAVSGTTITLEGMDTTGLTYTSGGTFYKVPQSRTNALAYQDGVLVKSGTSTRRYIGSFKTVASAQTEDSNSRRLVYTYQTNVLRPLYAIDTNTWSYAGSGNKRAANVNTTAGVGRCEVMVGFASPIHLLNAVYCSSPGGANVCVAIGLDSNISFASNQQINEAGSNPSTVWSTINYNLAAGYHFLQRIEGVQATASFLGTNAFYENCGLSGNIVQ